MQKNQKNLLIIDDEGSITKGLHELLNEIADKIFIASNGQEALDLLKKHPIHCIVSDIMMPQMDGVQLIKKVRESNNNVPFIFYTGIGNQELMLEASKYGAFDFLNKPNLIGLEECVARGLQTGIGEDPAAQANHDENISEYKKLLEQISKKKS